jgi:chaperonin GroEL
LGTAAKVVVTRHDTLVVANGKTKEAVDSRADEVRRQLEDPTLDEGEEKFQRERLARLAGGVATIKVGGATEVEMKERKDRVEDALNATKAAVEEGIVPGGGTALAKLAHWYVSHISTDDMTPAVKAGMMAVAAAMQSPLHKIIDNAGGKSDVVLASIVSYSDDPTGWPLGYNVATDKYGNLFEMGVIDPVKVTRYALENAASVAGIFLTLDCAIVVDESDETKDK